MSSHFSIVHFYHLQRLLKSLLLLAYYEKDFSRKSPLLVQVGL